MKIYMKLSVNYDIFIFNIQYIYAHKREAHIF